MFKQPSHKNLDFEQEFSHSRTAESTIKRCLNKVIEIRVQFAKISDNKIVSENLEELQHELLDLIYSGKLSDKDVENTKNNEPENEPENDWIEPFPMSIDDEEKPTQMNVEVQAEKEREEKEPEADVEFKNETEFRRINRGKPVSTIINLKFNRVLRMVKDGMDIKDALSALGISIGTFYYAISKEKKEKLAKAKKRATAAKVKRAEEQKNKQESLIFGYQEKIKERDEAAEKISFQNKFNQIIQRIKNGEKAIDVIPNYKINLHSFYSMLNSEQLLMLQSAKKSGGKQKRKLVNFDAD